MWSTMEQWAGNSTSSLNIYVRALDVAPTDQVLLGELIDVAIATSQCARAADVLADRDDALGLWYLGRARFGAGTDAGTEPANAETFLQAAIVAFESSAAANADYGDSTLIWIASCTGALGFTALQQERFGLAEEKFLESAKLAPARVNENIHALGSVKLGLLRVVDHHYSSDDLPSAIATLQAASAVIEDDADLSNNLGLFARDHGVALEREGDTTQAKQLFELSYTAYQNSVRIEPESVRLRNDLMLMLLYHLKRDLDQVPEVLAGCIKDGERQLAEEPPTDAEALRDLQEAVGDCYENLGLYYMRFGNDKANARMNFEKSLTFYPLRQRASVALLRELDG
jgi:tetratricopeptide (TPR) repeat protein